MIVKPYPLDNDHELAGEHHDALAEALDPATVARLRGVRPDWTGAACLEVGAGGGSIARYLADQVGATGRVVALDLKPQHIPDHPRMTVVQHDLCSDEPLPAGPWDLIHARLVLCHLPARETILRRLAQVLAPGGVILTEDWETMIDSGVVVAAPTADDAALYQRYQSVIGPKVFGAAGTDRRWARRAPVAMRQAGLVSVETSISAEIWAGGGRGTRMVHAVTYELEAALVAAGFPAEDLAPLRALLTDPRLLIHGHPRFSTSGWRPLEPDATAATWSSVYEA